MRPHEFQLPVKLPCDRCVGLEERISELEQLLLLARSDVTDLEARVVSEEAMHRLEVERLGGRSGDEEGGGVDIG